MVLDLSKYTKLVNLYLKNLPISKLDLSKCSSLRDLNLQSCPDLTNLTLPDGSKLTNINIYECNIKNSYPSVVITNTEN